jgi:very-short-patch-repair endonuclease
MSDSSEQQRLEGLYERLRLKLLDLSRKNRMLNYSLGVRSQRYLQIVDDVLEGVYSKLVGDEARLRVSFLPEPDGLPPEEKTDDFLAALEHAKVSDIDYLTKLDALERDGRDDEIELARLELHLRDRVRAQLGLPPRPTRADINRSEHARSLGIDPGLELQPGCQKSARDSHSIQTLKYPDELERLVNKIAGQARLAEQEMGVSTLFLAFGFLEWYESDDSDKKAYAPLLLLPVKLETEKVRGKEVTYISAREGAAEANLSLQKLLEQYSRELANFEVDEEGAIGSVEEYLNLTRDAIDGLKRWQIRRWLVLGHFAFGRFVIYSDLKRENWQTHPVIHPLVNAILSGVERGQDEEPTLPSIPDDYPIDDPEIEKIAPLLIQDADASQHSALVDVMRGKNLVIQGPPGTGKSQTITNIIANALAEGKRVLFLSEKQAALDVVKRRLDLAGLGDFCLELHSDKASPKAVIESLKKRSELGWGKMPTASPHTANINAIGWNESRSAIARYLAGLHAERPDGNTPFMLIWKALRGRTQNADLMESFKSCEISKDLLLDPIKLASVHTRMTIFADVLNAFINVFGHPARSPWADLSLGDIHRYDIERLILKLTELRTVALELAGYFERYATPLTIETIGGIGQLIELDSAIGDPPDGAPIAKISALDLDELARNLREKRSLIEIDRALSGKPDLSQENPNHLSLASSLIASGAPVTLIHMQPAGAYAAAAETVEQLSSVIRIFESCVPILRILSIGEDLPSNALPTVAIATLVASRIPDQHREWIGTLPRVDETAFSTAHDHWKRLRASESDWRRKLKEHGSGSWPGADELRAAAAILRRSGLSALVAAINGARRAAHELTAMLGFSASSATLADEVGQLADHVQAMTDFEVDGDIAGLLGSFWQGILTPFDEIAAGAKLRRAIHGQLVALPCGERVAHQLLALPNNELAALADFAGTARSIQDGAENLRRLDEKPIDEMLPAIRAQLSVLNKFLLVDPGRALASVEIPIQQISDVATLLAQKSDISQRLARSPLAYAIEALGGAEAEIDDTERAIDWVKSVQSGVAQGPLRMALTRSDAQAVRQLLHEAALAGAAPSRSYMTLMESLSSEFGVSGLSGLSPNALVERLDFLTAHRAELADFLAIRDHRRELDAAGLADFLACSDRLVLAPARLPVLFEALVAFGQADLARRASSEFGRQDGATLDAQRRRFAERDRIKINSDRSVVTARLLQEVPARGSDTGPRGVWTGMALLRNEFPKQRRFTPVRGLLSRAGDSILTLKPCFMMSPLSLAKFAKPGQLEFDIVVVDEASQMKPEEALGALLRTKQIVVVGDANQLPPTDFFNRSTDTVNSDDDFEDIDDESILEACEKTFREVRPLKWHYRSRCESLIAFSNAEFYRNSLITFPMARPGSFSIDLVRVGGTYQARRNVAEAVRVAEESIQFMRHFAEMSEETIPTLGVVSVNIDQRDLIQEELRRLSAGDELVERYCEKVQKRGEALFVKNLENVQGDERDFIFISLTYGREPGATAPKQRFGPINGKQGHRRLNVLFSRARIRVALFASLGSADVKPSESSAKGPHVLKRYLEYAENRGRAAVERIQNEPDSDFEVEVGERLRAKGYQIDFQVGVSGYKIDLGVRHPNHKERFLAGVECDGARYHSSKSARDRDRLREEVLRGLGWEILRVWSTDWFDNPELETDKLVAKLEQLKSGAPRTFHDYRVVDPFTKEQAEPIAEMSSLGRGDHGASIPRVDLDYVPPSVSHSERTVEEEPLFASDKPLTIGQASKALEQFRELVIKTEMDNWEPHRSILRDSMIETFVMQHISDPEEWFQKVPQFQRSGTNPLEKRLFLTRICEIVERIDGSMTQGPEANEPFALTPVNAAQMPYQTPLPLRPSANDAPTPRGKPPAEDRYVVADLADLPVAPCADRFYEPGYKAIIGRMTSYIIEIEGPVYDDVLITRIARVHGFQRTGSTIQKLVLSAIDHRFPRTREDGRDVFWCVGAQTGAPVPFRKTTDDVRSHNDIPIPELASLALPFVRIRMDDEQVLRKMVQHFGLGRLREVTRIRFQKAVAFAKSTINSGRLSSSL